MIFRKTEQILEKIEQILEKTEQILEKNWEISEKTEPTEGSATKNLQKVFKKECLY